MAKMSTGKKIIIAVVVVALIVGGGLAAYFIWGNNDETNDSASTSDTSQTQNQQSQASINDLLARSENVTCTFTYTDDSGNASSGTVYIASGERMRGDFSTSTTDQGQLQTGLIQTEDMIYTWDKSTKSGVSYSKGTLDAGDQPAQDQQTNQESVDRDQQYDFNCNEWNVDEGQFTPPSDVNFTNYDKELQQAQELGQQAEGIRQQACQQIADEGQRAACENAL